MFKYIILITFHRFTQYYKNEIMYYMLLWEIVYFFIFLCALYKKLRVGELPGRRWHRTAPRLICSAFWY